MSTAARFVVGGVLVLAIGFVVWLRPDGDSGRARTAAPDPAAAALPRLVDFGSDQCVPCKAMVPVLEALRREYEGRLRVDFIDAWRFPERAEPFDVYAIPTQVFFDPAGRELFRHTGFISKEDILETWRKLGYTLTPAGTSSQP